MRIRQQTAHAIPVLRVLLAAVAALAAVVALAAAPAGAHDGDAVIGVEAAEPQADGSVRYVVRVTWANDGHAAVGTTVTATPVDAAGATQTPVPMNGIDQDGRYEATVIFPASGAWTVRFTSINPNGTSEQAQEVALPAPTTTAAPTTGTQEPTTTEAETGAAAASQPDSDDGEGGGGGGGAAVLAVALVVLVVAGVGGFLALRRRGGGPGTSETSGTSDPSGTAPTDEAAPEPESV